MHKFRFHIFLPLLMYSSEAADGVEKNVETVVFSSILVVCFWETHSFFGFCFPMSSVFEF